MVSRAEGVSALDSWNDAISASTYIEEPLDYSRKPSRGIEVSVKSE